MNDLELSNERASSAEREVLMLKEKLEEMKEEDSNLRDAAKKDAAAAQDEDELNRIDNPNLARELSAKEREVQQLMSDIQKLKQEKQDEMRRLEGN